VADIARSAGSRPPTRAGFIRPPRTEAVLSGGLLVLVGLVSLYPLGRLVALAFGPGEDGALLGTLADGLGSRGVRRALLNSLAAAGGATAVAVLLGAGLALALGLGRFRGRAAATFLLLSPLLVPSQIMALAWIELVALLPVEAGGGLLYSGWGIAALMGVEAMPLVFLATRAAMAGLPPDLIEAARIGGASSRRILGRVILPLLLPAILGGAVLAFAASVGNFGIPALLGIPGRFPMLTTLAYQRLNGFGPSVLPQVAVTALILAGLVLGALAVRAVLLKRLSVPVEAGPGGLALRGADATRPLAEALVWSSVALLAVVPVLALAASSLAPALGVALSPRSATLANYGAVLASAAVRRAILNSAWLSLGMALAAGALALPLAYLARMRRGRGARLAALAAEAPFAVPGTVVALAFVLVFLPPLPLIGVSIYATPAILFLAYVARFLPLVLGPVSAALGRLDPALDDAGRVSGVRLWRRLSGIAAPLAAPAAGAGMVLAALTAFNELTVSSLLWSAGVETVGVMVFAFQYEGNSGAAAALSVLSILVVSVLAALFDRLGRRVPGIVPWRD
jgi:iron(III) transport system permease protein